MEFTYDGQVYRLEFRRLKEKHKSRVSTTATLTRRSDAKDPRGYPIWVEVKSAKVGAHPDDVFSHEGGRLSAIVKLVAGLERPFRKAIGDAYHNRRLRAAARRMPEGFKAPFGIQF